MITSFDIWKVLAGIAIFLLGIRFLEESLQQLSGRRFKLFLKKQTSNKLRAIGGGAIVTGVLQSSSLVSLMVLAFVGASVIPMENALAVILGANLGTTLDSWIVAVAGFKLNIENIALPVAGLAGIGYAVFNKESKLYNWCRFLLGFGFLFVGLGYMKTGMEGLVLSTDFSQFKESPILIFFIIGFIITTLIQSSSATIAITLSALNAGAVALVPAMAIVLGSEVGTTIKLFVAGLKGVANKKRVALGNFIFNAINVLLILIFLHPLNKFITEVIGIKNNLYALVFFQTLVNILGIILFYPFLGRMTRFLEKQFRDSDSESLFIHKVSPLETSTALLAMEKENRHFLNAVITYSLSCFEKNNEHPASGTFQKKFLSGTIAEKYAYLKYLYGEIHSFYIQVQKNCTDSEDIDQLERFMSSVRNAMYAAKSIKDAIADIEQLRNSSNDVKYDFYLKTRQSVEDFCKETNGLLNETVADRFEKLTGSYHIVTEKYTVTLQQLYKESIAGHVSETEISTLLNFNREIFTFFKSLLFGAKDHLFDREQSKYFEDLPGFIR
ncbi:MAG: Na/Pi cotransporter family protein [Chitinophagaceae bacterium]|nr:Na/Pi cotransporter family protein [Chitinophagaceae bacterium]